MEKNCKHKRYILSGMLLLMASGLSAQTSEYDHYAGWYKQWNDSLRGANIIGAQRVLQAHKAKKKQKVVVGVIDSGQIPLVLRCDQCFGPIRKRSIMVAMMTITDM